jgi:hypothetical protein
MLRMAIVTNSLGYGDWPKLAGQCLMQVAYTAGASENRGRQQHPERSVVVLGSGPLNAQPIEKRRCATSCNNLTFRMKTESNHD